MVLDTRLLDIITLVIQEFFSWCMIVVSFLFTSPLFPLFIVSLIIAFLFVCIKIIRYFIWGA